MMRHSLFALVVSALVVVPVAKAGPIFSGPATITSTGGTLVFDLLAGGDLGNIADLPNDPASYDLQVISTVWTFSPPPGATGTVDLGATLALAGLDSGLSFSETIDLSDETGNVVFSTAGDGQTTLPFSEELAQELLQNNGQITGNLIPDPGSSDEWDSYFASGASLTNYLFVELTTLDPNVIPEPSAVLVWGAVGLVGLAAHRRFRRRRTA